MRVAIVDDEPEAIENLKDALNTAARNIGITPEIDAFQTGAAFSDAWKENHSAYSIVFLDIYIDEKSGLDLAGEVRAASEQTMIIFVTTSRENMPEAFRFHAFDYIVKPLEQERINALLMDAVQVLPKINRYMRLTVNRKEVHLLYSECVCATTRGHYIDVTAKDGTVYPVRLTVRKFLALVEKDKRFLLINKGIVVNMDYIKAIEDGVCIMVGGDRLPLKVRQMNTLRQTWQNYCFDKLRAGQETGAL